MKQVLAALSFFTRIPFWRLTKLERHHYEKIIPLWPLTGWLTGGVMALAFYLCSLLSLPLGICVLVAMSSRIIITGAMHEDSFAKFCNGFGNGKTRDGILDIMKNSRIGSYGVISLVFHICAVYIAITELMQYFPSPLIFILADSGCKAFSSMITFFLPFAGKEEEAKEEMIYAKQPVIKVILSIILGLLPLSLIYLFIPNPDTVANATLTAYCASLLICLLLFRRIHSGIQGYTGDCCGATFIVTEGTFYLAMLTWFCA